jgi:hypothetical protein
MRKKKKPPNARSGQNALLGLGVIAILYAAGVVGQFLERVGFSPEYGAGIALVLPHAFNTAAGPPSEPFLFPKRAKSFLRDAGELGFYQSPRGIHVGAAGFFQEFDYLSVRNGR